MRKPITLCVLVACVVAVLVGGALHMSRAENTPTQVPWGAPKKGIALFAQLLKTQYKVNDPIEAKLTIMNTTDEKMNLYVESPYNQYFLVLVNESGKPVPYSKHYQEILNTLASDTKVVFMSSIEEIGPKGTYGPMSMVLSNWFDITEPGTYSLVILREVSTVNADASFPHMWKEGMAASNAVTFTVTK